MKPLARDLIQRMPELTVLRSSELVLGNVELNKPYVQKTVLDLMQGSRSIDSQSAIVIAAGPSLHRTESIRRIVESGYSGTIVCADGALGHCLRGGLVPDFVITLDPHSPRIVRWFGDPDLTADNDDDYFKRQDLDTYFADDELVRNQEMIKLVDKHGPNIKAIVCTSVSLGVTKRVIASGMDVYWWNPVLDDFANVEGLTRKAFNMNKVPCMTSGGNGGTAAWVFTHAILGAKEIALTGMDFSYAPDTPLEKTQYYKEIVDIFGDRASEAFISVENPYLNQTWFTDPAYYWYRDTFLQMAEDADCSTLNCTEGGILFGDSVKFTSLTEFLNSPAQEYTQSGGA